MKKSYSFKKGLGKGFVTVLTILLTAVSFAGFADVALWDLAVTHIKPVLGSLTVGGLITLGINFVKYNYLTGGD